MDEEGKSIPKELEMLDILSKVYEGVDEDLSALESKAKLFNCDIEFCQSHEVQIDLDSPEAEENFNERMGWFQTVLQHKKTRNVDHKAYEGGGQVFPDLAYIKTISKSGNTHITVHVGFNRYIDDYERLLIAVLLGSDLNRETLNYFRLKLHGDMLACFFVPKQKLLTTTEPALLDDGIPY